MAGCERSFHLIRYVKMTIKPDVDGISVHWKTRSRNWLILSAWQVMPAVRLGQDILTINRYRHMFLERLWLSAIISMSLRHPKLRHPEVNNSSSLKGCPSVRNYLLVSMNCKLSPKAVWGNHASLRKWLPCSSSDCWRTLSRNSVWHNLTKRVQRNPTSIFSSPRRCLT